MGGGRPHLSTRQANPPWHSLQPPEADVPITLFYRGEDHSSGKSRGLAKGTQLISS